jgi:hypothetical protein
MVFGFNSNPCLDNAAKARPVHRRRLASRIGMYGSNAG